MQFFYNQKREWGSYAQRSVAMGQWGMVASSQLLASLTGHKVLSKGGNAIDAAVAMVSTLSVVEPFSVGVGGDAFALIYLAKENKVIGMNASGRAPYGASLEWFRSRGISVMPDRGILSVTVPGALHGWAQAIEQYGTWNLADLFEDAIYYAENGFPVTEIISGEWKNMEDFLNCFEGASRNYLIGGKAPRPGQVFSNKDLARTYRKIAQEGIQAFYEGDICKLLVDLSQSNGGLLSYEDFRSNKTTWVEPIWSDYRGCRVYELPPNGQGITALEMLNILEGYDIARLKHNSPEYLHILTEAKKIAFNDRDRYITDPDFEKIPVDMLLSKDYAGKRREEINFDRARVDFVPALCNRGSETVFLAAVDEQRNAVSFISSLYTPFGSGMVADGTGIILQNRGSSFSLDPKLLNRLEPHKRPMHTIIPGMVFENGMFTMCFGVMGGEMQPQGHVQFLINLIDFKMNLQEALDAPRARHMEGDQIYLEEGIPEETAWALQKKGHHIVQRPRGVNEVGGGQAIYLDREQNVLLGASDRRKDGAAIGY